MMALDKLLFIILTLVFFYYIAGIVPSFDCEVAKSSRKMWAFHTGDAVMMIGLFDEEV